IPLKGVTAVFGPSGAGKSMLLATIAGLHKLASGRVVLAGRVLEDAESGVRTAPHQRDVSLVFQESRLFPHLTVRGNLDYAARRATPKLALPAIEEIARRLEIGELLGRQVRDLSGGERSRVALARALLSAPSLLLLDEPFAALDGRRRRAFIAMLLELNAATGLPMMVVTHTVEDVADLSDHVVAMKGGAVVASGKAGDVMGGTGFQALLDRRDIGARIDADRITGESGRRGRAVWARADTVLIAAEAPRGLSARNVWPGRVVAISREADGAALVSIRTSAGVVLSRITPEALNELGLAEDKAAWAVVKTHAI
ncbi:MAG: ATP-binding cassette domain-containing protein, partial [Alphaproteobacteria bacterium]|nr:ATP-binding cassette domain-containing protein [Alphaproteobacteria bacterium]